MQTINKTRRNLEEMVMSSNADKDKAKEELGAAETKIENLKVDKKVYLTSSKTLKSEIRKALAKGEAKKRTNSNRSRNTNNDFRFAAKISLLKA